MDWIQTAGGTKVERPARPSVLIGTPPLTAVGGIATHSGVLSKELPEGRVFDQWWPLSERSPSAAVRAGVHALALGRLVAALATRRPEVLHLQVSQRGIARDIVHARVARRLGVPVLAHLHSEFAAPELASRLAELIELASGVVVLDAESAARLRELVPTLSGEKVAVLPNPVRHLFTETPVTERMRSTSEIVLLCPALIGDLKNQRGVLRALDRCADAGVSARLVLAGPWDPELDGRTRREIETHRATQYVGVLGPHELLRHYDEADALVLFSRTEGEPMVILEAMARALPILASDVGGIRQMVPEHPANLIVPEGDVEGLAQAIVHLAALSPHERRVETNRTRVLEQRSPTVHVTSLRYLYGRLAQA